MSLAGGTTRSVNARKSNKGTGHLSKYSPNWGMHGPLIYWTDHGIHWLGAEMLGVGDLM